MIKILNSAAGDYQPAALLAAKRELERRSLSEDQVAVVKNEIEQEQRLDETKEMNRWALVGKLFHLFFRG